MDYKSKIYHIVIVETKENALWLEESIPKIWYTKITFFPMESSNEVKVCSGVFAGNWK